MSLELAANDVLFKNKQVFIKKKFEKVQNTVTSKTSEELDYDENLFNVLRDLRMQIARENNIAPFIVFSDASLKQMAHNFPLDAESMLNISGVGLNKFDRYGNNFINVISKYVKENNISIPEKNNSSEELLNIDIKKSNNKLPSQKKEDTRITTYNLYKSGKSINEIAIERNLTKNTIENHLIACYELGMDIDIEKDIHTEFENNIVNVIHELGTEKLRPLKDALPDKVSYLDIRYYIAKINKTG